MWSVMFWFNGHWLMLKKNVWSAIVNILIVNSGCASWGWVYDDSVTVSILQPLWFTSWGSSTRHHSAWAHCMWKPEWSKFIPTMKPYIPSPEPRGQAQCHGASETCRCGFPFSFRATYTPRAYACVSKSSLVSRWSVIEGQSEASKELRKK